MIIPGLELETSIIEEPNKSLLIDEIKQLKNENKRLLKKI